MRSVPDSLLGLLMFHMRVYILLNGKFAEVPMHDNKMLKSNSMWDSLRIIPWRGLLGPMHCIHPHFLFLSRAPFLWITTLSLLSFSGFSSFGPSLSLLLTNLWFSVLQFTTCCTLYGPMTKQPAQHRNTV